MIKRNVVLISARFDPRRDDPLSDMMVTEEGFARLTAIVRDISNRFANGHMISLLEGGYNLTALRNSLDLHVRELMESPTN